MKSLSRIIVIVVSLLLQCGLLKSQDAVGKEYRIALRVNTLGFLNLNGMGDVELSLPGRVGVFVGGGSSAAMVYPGRLVGYTNPMAAGCKGSNWGLYGGGRLSLPVGKLSGLNGKVLVAYQHDLLQDTNGCLGWNPDVPDAPSVVKRETVSIFLAAGYTQVFLKRFFVEPVVGLGPQFRPASGGRMSYRGLGLPMQLNVGVRL